MYHFIRKSCERLIGLLRSKYCALGGLFFKRLGDRASPKLWHPSSFLYRAVARLARSVPAVLCIRVSQSRTYKVLSLFGKKFFNGWFGCWLVCYHYFEGRVWPELSRQCDEILAYCHKFYMMQDQRKNVFSQFFAARRAAALRLVRGFIYSSKRPILILRAFTRILVGDVLQAVRIAGSPRGTALVLILFTALCLVVFIGCGLLFLL